MLTDQRNNAIIIIETRKGKVLKMNKEQMMDEVIRKYGFENKWTIWFCELAEVLTESQLLNAYIILEAGVVPVEEDDEEYEEPDDIDSDFGFDPYMGCCSYDC